MHESVHSIVSLMSLTLMEIALCIDNAIFITILSGRLKTAKERNYSRQIGVGIALFINLLMLLVINLHDSIAVEIFEIFSHSYSVKDIILIGGGVFLIANSTIEIHNKMEGYEAEINGEARSSTNMYYVLLKITLMNIVFSFDSVLTAIAVVHELWKMVFAIVIALTVMYFFVRPIDFFVKKHPTTKILALSFLMLIGLVLIMEGLEEGVDKGYVYFAMSFSIFVEAMNIMILRKSTKVAELHEAHLKK